eukprot:699571_1
MDAANEQIMETNKTQSNHKDRIKQIAKECGTKLLSARFLLVAGVVVSVGLFTEGWLCLGLCEVNVRSYILSIYYMVFALLSIGAEFKFQIISQYLRILFSYSGRGFWYIFLGTIALGGEWWAVLMAILLIMLGCLNIIAGCQRGQTKSTYDDNDHAEDQLESESNVEPQKEIRNNDVNVSINEQPISDQGEGANNQAQENDDDNKVNPFSDYEDY